MFYVTQSQILTRLMHSNSLWQRGLAHWKIIRVMREVECASMFNNSSPDDWNCLKFRLEDAKVHQVILQRSKIFVSNWKCVIK